MKVYTAGGELARRRNHEADTIYVHYTDAGKRRALNNDDGAFRPHSTTDGALRRRSKVARVGEGVTFTADPDEVDPRNRVYRSDPGLKDWASTEDAALEFWVKVLPPYMKTDDAATRRNKIICPCENIKQGTKWYLAKRVRKELNIASPPVVTAGEDVVFRKAKKLVEATHCTWMDEHREKRFPCEGEVDVMNVPGNSGDNCRRKKIGPGRERVSSKRPSRRIPT